MQSNYAQHPATLAASATAGALRAPGVSVAPLPTPPYAAVYAQAVCEPVLPPPSSAPSLSPEAPAAPPVRDTAPGSEMDEARWLMHYRNNQLHRAEPDWGAPLTLDAARVRALARSVAQFQLGDGGGPACLIAWDAQSFRGTTAGTQELVDLWFKEEKEHSRLLGCLLARLGGTPIAGHWSFSCFCGVRKVLGVRFELMALLLTEIAATVYYRLMRRHTEDGAVRQVCTLILRDEGGHIAFHRDRMAFAGAGRAGAGGGGGRKWRPAWLWGRRQSPPPPRYGWMWEAWFRALGLGAGTMLWVNHAAGLCPQGAGTVEFYAELWQEMSTFLRRLRRDVRRLQRRRELLHQNLGA